MGYYPIGSRVLVGDGMFGGMVTAVTIREGGKATYEIVWWDKAIRFCQWFEACEVQSVTDQPSETIGFLPRA
jgi:hypothetical protein